MTIHMQDFFNQLLNQYDYELPEELIAQEPAEPRDSAQLLVYNKQTHKIGLDTFSNITQYLPANSVVVFNQTKVLPARLALSKPTGGRVRVLYVQTEQDTLLVMADRHLQEGSVLHLTGVLTFTVVKQTDKYYVLRPSFAIEELFDILETYGHTPIPPYIKHSPLSEKDLRDKYQTVFAQEKGSVAAPTASLHFTEELLQKLKDNGHDVVYVTLHVNLGTFAPLTKEHVTSGKLHKEWYSIPKSTQVIIEDAKLAGRPIIAVGTTVVRALESAANPVMHNRVMRREDLLTKDNLPHRHSGRRSCKGSSPESFLDHTMDVNESSMEKINNVLLKQPSGTTDLFISEGYQFKVIDGLVTNFHVPKSSLLLLVAAYIGREKLFDLYLLAIEKRYKFFSFGDGMLLY